MSAAVLRHRSEPTEVRDDVAVTPVGPGEGRVRIVAAGACRGDLSLEATMRLPQAGGLGLEGITVQRVPLDPPDDAPDAPRRGEVVRTDIEMG